MPVVLITGCSSGFGLGAALAFARRGETVVATVRDIAKADLLQQAAGGANIDVVALDVTDPRSRAAAIEDVEARHGRIDVLVNNAGIFSFGPAETLGEADLRAMFEANVFGAFAMMMAVLPGMRARRSGRVVNVSSAAALAVRPFMTGYAATKHALDAITTGLDGELRPFNIRVTSVCPVSFVTSIVRATPATDTPYGDLPTHLFEEFIAGMQSRPDPSPAVAAIVEAATAADPLSRYLVAPQIVAFDAIVAAKEQLESARRLSTKSGN
jgi:NAD(P)-dependent dehydrogenase (short-subunit alcohol dehydrogenase family)